MSFADNRIIIPEVPHSSRGASSAPRWLKCAGSIQLVESLVKNGKRVTKPGPAAAEGTAAHTLLSTAMEDGSDAWEFSNLQFVVGGWTFVVDDEMQQGVQEALDLARKLTEIYRDKKPIVYIEKRLGSILNEDAWGTPDIVILIPGERLIVIDFKYGRGVSVEPTSAQLKYYGYLACENYLKSFADVSAVDLWISQPRIPHPSGTSRKFETTPTELEDWWMNVLIPGLEETYKPNALLMVGEHCRFCPAYNLCPALQKETYEFAIDIEPSHIPNDQIWALREKAAALAKYGDRLEEDAFRRRMRGEIVPGCKVVRKKANRVFKESIVEPNPDDPQNPVVLRFEDEAIRIFKDDAYQPKAFRTPPAIQKLDGGKAFVSKWAYKPDTGLTLAPDSDKRSEVKRPMEMYMDLIDQVSDEDSEAPY